MRRYPVVLVTIALNVTAVRAESVEQVAEQYFAEAKANESHFTIRVCEFGGAPGDARTRLAWLENDEPADHPKDAGGASTLAFIVHADRLETFCYETKSEADDYCGTGLATDAWAKCAEKSLARYAKAVPLSSVSREDLGTPEAADCGTLEVRLDIPSAERAAYTCSVTPPMPSQKD